MESIEKLAYEAALRSLDKQERLLEELRSRTGVLLAASSLAASFLGREAFRGDPSVILAGLALAAFLVSIITSALVLLPRGDFVFALSGVALYEGLYATRDDLEEAFRRLAYDLYRFWDRNDEIVERLMGMYRLAATSLVVEIVVLIAMTGSNL